MLERLIMVIKWFYIYVYTCQTVKTPWNLIKERGHDVGKEKMIYGKQEELEERELEVDLIKTHFENSH